MKNSHKLIVLIESLFIYFCYQKFLSQCSGSCCPSSQVIGKIEKTTCVFHPILSCLQDFTSVVIPSFSLIMCHQIFPLLNCSYQIQISLSLKTKAHIMPHSPLAIASLERKTLWKNCLFSLFLLLLPFCLELVFAGLLPQSLHW